MFVYVYLLEYELLLEDSQCKYGLCSLYECHGLYNSVLLSYLPTVPINIVFTKTVLSMMPFWISKTAIIQGLTSWFP